MEKNYAGLKVLDFTRVLAGPYLTMMLADNGAEVIKVERPGSGADERGLAPIIESANGTQSAYYLMLNRGKKSIVLDMKDPDCAPAIESLIRWADVICENFAPGVMDKLGYGYTAIHKLNPSAIVCSISTFGKEGPLANRPGYDILAQATSGLMWLTGDPDGSPMRSGTSIGDVNAAAHALGAIGAALYYRSKTGKGQHIDIALRDCLTAILETGVIRYTISDGQDNPMRCGACHATMMPYGVFKAGKGQYIALSALQERHWDALCRVMNKEAWGAQKKFSSSILRAVNQKELVPELEAWLQTFSDVREVIRQLEEVRVPVAPVMTVEQVLHDEQYLMRNNLVEVDDPVAGPVTLPTTPMLFSETTVHNPVAPPTLGQHTAEILRAITAMPEDAICRLVEKYGPYAL